jgi:hypothetical protein
MKFGSLAIKMFLAACIGWGVIGRSIGESHAEEAETVAGGAAVVVPEDHTDAASEVVWEAIALSCEDRIRDAEGQPPLSTLIERVKQWCSLSPRPGFRGVPPASCCPLTDRGCNGQECASYDTVNHKICLCMRPGCNATDEGLRENLTEEYWHAWQNCRRSIPGDHLPYPPPVLDCEALKITVGGGTFRCCGLNSQPGRMGPTSWCNEINAKCNNPNDSTPLKESECGALCDGYGEDEIGKKCCRKTCETSFKACCKWTEWPLQPPPTATPSPAPSPRGSPAPGVKRPHEPIKQEGQAVW